MEDDTQYFTARLRCPHCKRETFFKLEAPSTATEAGFLAPPWLETLYPAVDVATGKDSTVYIVENLTKCPESDCEGPVLFIVRYEFPEYMQKYYFRGGRHFTKIGKSVQILAMYPDGRRPSLHPSIPEAIRREWGGVMEMAEHRRSPATVLMACRAVLENATKELERASGEMGTPKAANTLQRRIDSLAERGIITGTLRDWSHELRIGGNESAHDLVGDPDRALEFARFVEFFLEATFVMESRLTTVRRQPTTLPEGPDIDDLLGGHEGAEL